MNRNAANALLKILEEPPRRGLLLLVSHSPGRLLPTVRSRCRHFPLATLPRPVILQLLRQHAFDGRLGTDGHEDRRFDPAAGGEQTAGTRLAALLLQFESA